MTTTDALSQHAAAGRGLYVALVPSIADLPEHPDAHVTLAHLGKRSDARLAIAAHAAAAALARRYSPISASVGGVARFRGSVDGHDPIVLLLQHSTIRTIRADLLDLLVHLHVPFSTHFDYTPHVTLQRVAHDVVFSLPTVSYKPLTLDHIAVVCGDAHVLIPLAGATA